MKWSYSAHKEMRRSQRQFMFSHIVAWHNTRDPERREAYVLKQLQDPAAWRGSIVHHILATYLPGSLTTQQDVDKQELTALACDLARRRFNFSAAQQYRTPGLTKSGAGEEFSALALHEFGLEVPANFLADTYQTLAGCFENLATQRALIDLLWSGSNHMFEVDLQFHMDGDTITARLDLVFISASGKLVIVDWKVGESETSDYSTQVLVYALVALRCGRWPDIQSAEDIELYEVNLLEGRIKQHYVDEERLLYIEGSCLASEPGRL